jgi:hypothetical protein
MWKDKRKMLKDLPLTQHELDDLKCHSERCDHNSCIISLFCSLHPQQGVRVNYSRSTGTLLISCSACTGMLAEIEVAE